MEYKSEPIVTNFGKGVRIEKGNRSYEQVTCRDGLYARIFNAPREEDGKLVDTNYHGIIFRKPFDDTEGDYEQFKILAERLQQASGEEVPNTKARFMDYIAHSGLETKLQRIGVIARINLKDKEELPKNTFSWLNRRSYLGGAITSLAGYAGGFAIIANTVPNEDLRGALGFYGGFAPLFEVMLGVFAGLFKDEKFWCGPLHAPGFITSRIINREKLRNPNYMLNKFMQNYQRLEELGSSVGNQKKFARQSKLADRHFGILEDLFPFTQHQKGFSIACDSQDKDEIINLFDYVLEGGNVPQLSNPKPLISKSGKEEKNLEVKPIQTNFVNPWEIEIPKIGGEKNE